METKIKDMILLKGKIVLYDQPLLSLNYLELSFFEKEILKNYINSHKVFLYYSDKLFKKDVELYKNFMVLGVEGLLEKVCQIVINYWCLQYYLEYGWLFHAINFKEDGHLLDIESLNKIKKIINDCFFICRKESTLKIPYESFYKCVKDYIINNKAGDIYYLFKRDLDLFEKDKLNINPLLVDHICKYIVEYWGNKKVGL